MIFVSALIGLLIVLILIPLDLLCGWIYKRTRKNVKSDIRFFYRCIPRRLKMPDFTKSIYFNRYPDKRVYSESFWNDCPTVDDPWLKDLAEQVQEKCKGKSDKYKAGYILKIAQCIYSYEKDSKIYGESDRWQFPVCTAFLRTGDCEDGSFLGAGLSYLCGLDAVMIYQTGHALYGVRVDGFGMKIKFRDKSYLKCETTSLLPMGITLNEGALKGAYTILIPAKDFIEKKTFIDDFTKYKG